MESVGSAMKKSFRPEPPVGPALAADEMVWAVEKSGLFLAGDDFLVDDLLDLGELTESENEDAAAAPPPPPVAAAEAAVKEEGADSSPFDPAPLSLPAPDEAELEWVSRIVDDSEEVYPVDRTLTGTRPLAPPLANPTLCTLSTESLPPVSVKAKRSKRSRTVTVGVVWSISNPPPFTDSSDSSTGLTNDSSSSSCSSPSSYSSYLVYDHSAAAGLAAPVLLDSSPAKRHRPKKRGRKPKAHQAHNHPLPLPPAAGERRCSHCGVNKTPQWRTGPQGAKTLCNACGVRFKSGRLLPEYRPACSPTFLSHVHSNSHRKVLEMRRKKEEQLLSAVAPPVTSF